jgi:hypothetical protein
VRYWRLVHLFLFQIFIFLQKSGGGGSLTGPLPSAIAPGTWRRPIPWIARMTFSSPTAAILARKLNQRKQLVATRGYHCQQWSSTCSTRTPMRTPRPLRGCARTSHINRNRLNPEPALILALTKIRPRIEVLACQKQADISLTGQNHINNW